METDKWGRTIKVARTAQACTAAEGCPHDAVRLLGKRPEDKRGNPRQARTEGVGPLCIKHYTRLLRRGSVDIALPHPSGPAHVQWRGDAVSYFAVHERIKRKLGSAKNYQCACGQPARQWAYDRTDPNELRDATGPYSTDLNRYQPMCVPCHKRMDLAHIRGNAHGFR